MKKKLNVLLIVFFSLAFILVGSTAGYAYYIFRTDSVVHWAAETYRLGTKQKYIIQINQEVKNTDGSIALPSGLFYTFVLPGESQQQPYVSGRQISSTLVDLNPYIGKEVHIEGFFSESIPLFLKNENIPEYFVTSQRATLNITSVTEAN